MDILAFFKDIIITIIEKICKYKFSKKFEFKVTCNKNQFEIINSGKCSIYNCRILLDEADIREITNFSRFVKNKDFSILKSKEKIIIKRIPDGNQKDDFKLTIMYYKKKKGKKVYIEDYNITI